MVPLDMYLCMYMYAYVQVYMYVHMYVAAHMHMHMHSLVLDVYISPSPPIRHPGQPNLIRVSTLEEATETHIWM